MDRQNVFEWLWLVNCFGCGSNRIWEFMSEFPDVSAAYEAVRNPEKRKPFLTAAENRSAERVTEEQVNELISYCEEHNIYLLTFDDEIYPEKLRSIYDPPALLFCRGDISCIGNDFSLSIVGTRKPSEYSVRVTESLVKELSALGITIVSGFAVGIDIASNLSAVRNGGKTVAVLGCGLDHDYPRENIVYREEIEKNGLFISEYFPKFTGNGRSFPARNRILSALSLGTIVVEAGVKSGSLITANLALSQGRDVFAVAPHNLFDRRYGGNVSLIRDGAVCLCGINDILYEYYENYGHKIANTARRFNIDIRSGKTEKAEDPSAAAKKKKTVPKAETKVSDDGVSPSEEPETKASGYDASILDVDEARIYDFLKAGEKPVLADELAGEFDMEISEMLSLLTDMELEGAISISAGGYTAN